MRVALNILFPLYLRFGIKVGIACMMAYGFSYLMGSPYATWAVVSTIIAMQVNVADSMQAGLLRLSGTIIGAVIGVAMLVTVPKSVFAIGAAVFLVTTVCGFLTRYSNRYAPISIAAVVVLLTAVQHVTSGYNEAITFGLMRVAEIGIGVGCAFLVSLILWPVRLVDTLRADLGLQFRECARLLDTLLNAFLARQQQLPYSLLDNIENRVWENHERLNKARKHESIIYYYEHGVMNIQVTALDRTAESLRTMMEALNDYDEEGRDPLMGEELRDLADAIMAALRHLGGDSPTAPAPDLVRGLTGGVAEAEAKLANLRNAGATKVYDLHKILQFFTFYQAMRVLSESLLMALDRLQAHTSKTETKKDTQKTGK